MRGKWAEGIQPRHFTWVMTSKLAVCERPGGYGDSHRRVRRQEEIIWLSRNDIGLICSLSEAPHNLHNYDAVGLEYVHHPWPARGDLSKYLSAVTEEITAAIDTDKPVVIHKSGIGDDVVALIASFLLLTGRVQGGPQVTAIVERIFNRRLGPPGRTIVELALRMKGDGNPEDATGGSASSSRPAA